jgi:hypothetical protein
MQYEIHENIIGKLETKIKKVENKCKKYGIDFYFEIVGETYREIENKLTNEIELHKYLIVDVAGHAQINGWNFIAMIEHTETGNIIRQADFEIFVPEKYRTAKSICEHCNVNRIRTYTAVIQHEETGEYKQVGKSCLKDYTGGMDSEAITYMMSFLTEIETAQNDSISGYGYQAYINIKDVLQAARAVTELYGYINREKAEEIRIESTATRVSAILSQRSKFDRELVEKMTAKGLKTEEIKNIDVSDIIDFIMNEEVKNNYISNIQTLLKSEYCKNKNFNFVVSAVGYYNGRQKAIDFENRQKKEKQSTEYHDGNIKDKISVKIDKAQYITNYETQYGTTNIYKFTANNVCYIWKTATTIENIEQVKEISGTIKDFNEYLGEKQTVLTRVKII